MQHWIANSMSFPGMHEFQKFEAANYSTSKNKLQKCEIARCIFLFFDYFHIAWYMVVFDAGLESKFDVLFWDK